MHSTRRSREFIPFHVPSIGTEEIEEVTSVLQSGWLTTGSRTARFEDEFRRFVHAPHAMAVNSGTAAMHLALAALGIGPGDEVITSPMTFCATVNVILHAGATPVLADIGPDGNIDPAAAARACTIRTRAILPVHLAGLPCRMDQIWRFARERGLKVIEDAAHALGASFRGQPVGGGDPASGNVSDAVAYSFYATKNLTTGEGGMVTTHDPELAEEMRLLCLHGISKDAWNRYSKEGTWRYSVVRNGFKYNLSDLQSALGLAQLRKQEQFLSIRARYAAMYNSAFAGVAELDTPAEAPDCRHAWHLYMLRLNLDRLAIDRSEFIERLRLRGIGTSVHFIPIPLHPFFAGKLGRDSDFPQTMRLYSRIVSLPLYPALSEDQVRRVARAVIDVAVRNRKRLVFSTAG